ncbi:MAG: hypothetical protein V4438_03865 [Patescibacteria group bacterium]
MNPAILEICTSFVDTITGEDRETFLRLVRDNDPRIIGGLIKKLEESDFSLNPSKDAKEAMETMKKKYKKEISKLPQS